MPHSGSDLDLVAVVSESAMPFSRSVPSWDTTTLPIPAEFPIHTEEEWQRLPGEQAQYARMLEEVTVWFYPT